MSRRISVVILLGALLFCAACTNKKVNNPLANVGSKQPDKVLFDRAMDAMKHNRFDVARMTLQTLINTYPDSEFIARAKLAVGAHPGLPDLMGFGRRRMDVSPSELKDYHRYQIGALAAFAQAAGTRVQHVKPHGIQYHMFEENLALGRATAEQVLELDPQIILMTMAMTRYDLEARKVKGVRIAAEGFADRVYADDGQLVTRKLGKDALITDPAKAADQAVRMAMEGKVHTITGKVIEAKVETICIHGDSPGSDKIVAAVREGLVKAGAIVKPLRDWLPR